MILGENTQKALEDLGNDTVKFARINLGLKKRYKRSSGRITSGRINSSGALSRGLFSDVKQSKNSFTVNVGAKGAARKYADVVEEGRRKGSYIPLGELSKWIRSKVRMRKDGKNVKKTDANVLAMARSISKNAHDNGIPGKHYLKDAIDMAFKKHKALLEDGLYRDVEQATGAIMRQLQTTGKNSR